MRQQFCVRKVTPIGSSRNERTVRSFVRVAIVKGTGREETEKAPPGGPSQTRCMGQRQKKRKWLGRLQRQGDEHRRHLHPFALSLALNFALVR